MYDFHFSVFSFPLRRFPFTPSGLDTVIISILPLSFVSVILSPSPHCSLLCSLTLHLSHCWSPSGPVISVTGVSLIPLHRSPSRRLSHPLHRFPVVVSSNSKGNSSLFRLSLFFFFLSFSKSQISISDLSHSEPHA